MGGKRTFGQSYLSYYQIVFLYFDSTLLQGKERFINYYQFTIK